MALATEKGGTHWVTAGLPEVSFLTSEHHRKHK